MTNKHLHIVALDTPWPVSYGGVIDLFYKLKALHKLGIQIHLHCFCKEELPQVELNNYCVEVHYYKRNSAFSLSIPYIVNSRSSSLLLENLNKNNYPILLEGIHCTYHLFKNKLQNRKVFVRLHNVEHAYYKHLAKNESNLLKHWYFLYESYLLKKYEANLANKAIFIAVSQFDAELYQKEFGAKQISFLPVFIEYETVQTNIDKGSYCLYHGNLSINENVKAIKWLLKHIFSDLKMPFVVAGKNPSKKIVNKIHSYANACVVENPSHKDMQDLIRKAQINILPSFNNTGVKLKLINALFTGKYCITNNAGVQGSGLETICEVADTADVIKEKITSLYNTPFAESEIEKRKQVLEDLYNNEENGRLVVSMIFN
jgi:glycosyltransferase involved in cell wall biosynthesis